MNLRMIGTLKLCNGSDYFSLLTLGLEAARNESLDLSNLVTCERDDLMDVSLKLSLTNGTKAWSTILSLDFLDENAAQIKMPIGKYMDLTIKAFTNAIDGKFICELTEKGNNSAQFSWKEKMTEDEITIRLGSCDMQAEDVTQTTLSMLSFSTARVCEIEKQIKASEADMKNLINDREQAMKRLEKFVGEKEQLEKELYAKFVAVLNEKKRKIRELEERLRENKDDKESTSEPSMPETPSKSKKRVVKKSRPVKVAAGTSLGKPENDSGSDTDVEIPSKTSKKVQKNIPNDDLMLDDSQNDSFSFNPRKKTKKTQ